MTGRILRIQFQLNQLQAQQRPRCFYPNQVLESTARPDLYSSKVLHVRTERNSIHSEYVQIIVATECYFKLVLYGFFSVHFVKNDVEMMQTRPGGEPMYSCSNTGSIRGTQQSDSLYIGFATHYLFFDRQWRSNRCSR